MLSDWNLHFLHIYQSCSNYRYYLISLTICLVLRNFYTCLPDVTIGTDYIFYLSIVVRFESVLISDPTPLHSSGIVDTRFENKFQLRTASSSWLLAVSPFRDTLERGSHDFRWAVVFAYPSDYKHHLLVLSLLLLKYSQELIS